MGPKKVSKKQGILSLENIHEFRLKSKTTAKFDRQNMESVKKTLKRQTTRKR